MTKLHYFISAPYHAGPEALERRAKVRDAHLEGIKRIVVNGSLKVGGPTTDPVDGHPTGSMFIIEAESIATVKDIIESDEYYKNNVWDKEKLNIQVLTLVPIPTNPVPQ